MTQQMPRAMRKRVRVAEGRHQGEPTCDNRGLMTIITSGSGTHRHCDLLGLFIPDEEMFPSCDLHTWLNRISLALSRNGVKREKGGAA